MQLKVTKFAALFALFGLAFAAQADQWVRFTVTQRMGGSNQDRDLQLDEFALYDAQGNRLTANLTQGSSAGSLQPGQYFHDLNGCTCDHAGLFDGQFGVDDYTWHIANCADDGAKTISKPQVVTIRLASAAAPVVGYNLMSSDNTEHETFHARSPTAWKVEISSDGQTWQTFDDHAADESEPALNKKSTWYAGGGKQRSTPTTVFSRGGVVRSVFLAGLHEDSRIVASSPYATGGDLILRSGNDEYIHVFYDSSAAHDFVVNRTMSAQVLVVGGGGGGGGGGGESNDNDAGGGGGGAGGFVTKTLALGAGTYEVMVGAGGAGGFKDPPPGGKARGKGVSGGDSWIAQGTHTNAFAYGGGGGGAASTASGDGSKKDATSGVDGGSGGGSALYRDNINDHILGGSAIDPKQGHSGGPSITGCAGGGGGGAGAAGSAGNGDSAGGAGGAGLSSDILGSEYIFAGGGGGGCKSSSAGGGLGGSSVGGAGGSDSLPPTVGLMGLGGGGGGGGRGTASGAGAAGGSGIVIIRCSPRAVLAENGYAGAKKGFIVGTFNEGGANDYVVYFSDTNPDTRKTFTVATAGYAEILVVGGGGAGGNSTPNYSWNGGINTLAGGGGGAGGVVTGLVWLAEGVYTVNVGAGGTISDLTGGKSSIVCGDETIALAYGGGRGGANSVGQSSACGGGGSGGKDGGAVSADSVEADNVGYAGGRGEAVNAGGGGGAGAQGSQGDWAGHVGNGGAGIASSITGHEVWYAGGGAGGDRMTYSSGGKGGGGSSSAGGGACTPGTDELGGGGGGASAIVTSTETAVRYGARGGSGVVIVRLSSQVNDNYVSAIVGNSDVEVFDNGMGGKDNVFVFDDVNAAETDHYFTLKQNAYVRILTVGGGGSGGAYVNQGGITGGGGGGQVIDQMHYLSAGTYYVVTGKGGVGAQTGVSTRDGFPSYVKAAKDAGIVQQALGGGGGGNGGESGRIGANGGGGGIHNGPICSGGSGSVGFGGGSSYISNQDKRAGGGGGAGAAGGTASASTFGTGGIGVYSDIRGLPESDANAWYGGGGAGGLNTVGHSWTTVSGGKGGGARAYISNAESTMYKYPGENGKGGGGGGISGSGNANGLYLGGEGGSGTVIVRILQPESILVDLQVTDVTTKGCAASATLVGIGTEDDAARADVMISWGTTEACSAGSQTFPNCAKGAVCDCPITGLSAGTKYYVKATAVRVSDSFSGSKTVSVTTLDSSYFVAPTASGTGDGTSWENATTLADAITKAKSTIATGIACTIRMKAGTYSVTAAYELGAGLDGLCISGGYKGASGKSLELAADPVSTLDGQTEFQIFNVTATAGSIMLERLSLYRGLLHTLVKSGGAHLEIVKCRFVENGFRHATQTGAQDADCKGATIYATAGSLVIEGTTFVSNRYHVAGSTLSGCDFYMQAGLFSDMDASGGALYASGLSQLAVSDSLFVNNGPARNKAGGLESYVARGINCSGQTVYVNGTPATFTRTEFRGNMVTGNNLQIGTVYVGGNAVMFNQCAFVGNGVLWNDTSSGVAGLVVAGGTVGISSCTFAFNASSKSAQGQSLYVKGGTVSVDNSIFHGNKADSTTAPLEISVAAGKNATLNYCLVPDVTTTYISGSGITRSNVITGDPLFACAGVTGQFTGCGAIYGGEFKYCKWSVDPSAMDVHLKSVMGRWNGSAWVGDTVTSPAIDAGDPASDYAAEPSPNGGRVNLGAYGNTAAASKSYEVPETEAATLLRAKGYSEVKQLDNGHTVLIFSNVTDAASFTVAEGGIARILVVGGGGSGGLQNGSAGMAGGGGAGGFVESNAVMLAAGTYTVKVGKGGDAVSKDTSIGKNGESSFVKLGGALVLAEAIGGGGGGGGEAAPNAGGSGGGRSFQTGVGGSGTPGQGFAGGAVGRYGYYAGGGGGGAGSVGSTPKDDVNPKILSTNGGDAKLSDITGELMAYAGGGAGCVSHSDVNYNSYTTQGGSAGGMKVGGDAYQAGVNGTGSGGGGGDAYSGYVSGAGGSGIVVVHLFSAWEEPVLTASLAAEASATDPTLATVTLDVAELGQENDLLAVLRWGTTENCTEGAKILNDKQPVDIGTHLDVPLEGLIPGTKYYAKVEFVRADRSVAPIEDVPETNFTTKSVEASAYADISRVIGADRSVTLDDGSLLYVFTETNSATPLSFTLAKGGLARLLVVGGGGAGGDHGYHAGTGGGGGGQVVDQMLSLDAGTYNVTVGAGGVVKYLWGDGHESQKGYYFAGGTSSVSGDGGAATVLQALGGGGGANMDDDGGTGANGGGGSAYHINNVNPNEYPYGVGGTGTVGFDGGSAWADGGSWPGTTHKPRCFGGGGAGAGGFGGSVTDENGRGTGGIGLYSTIFDLPEDDDNAWFGGGGAGAAGAGGEGNTTIVVVSGGCGGGASTGDKCCKGVCGTPGTGGGGSGAYLHFTTAAEGCQFGDSGYGHGGNGIVVLRIYGDLCVPVALDQNGGTGGASEVTVTVGQPLPKLGQLPTLTGFMFAGYWSEQTGGTLYYNPDGTSAKDYPVADGPTTLYAHWLEGFEPLAKLNFDGTHYILTDYVPTAETWIETDLQTMGTKGSGGASLFGATEKRSNDSGTVETMTYGMNLSTGSTVVYGWGMGSEIEGASEQNGKCWTFNNSQNVLSAKRTVKFGNFGFTLSNGASAPLEGSNRLKWKMDDRFPCLTALAIGGYTGSLPVGASDKKPGYGTSVSPYSLTPDGLDVYSFKIYESANGDPADAEQTLVHSFVPARSTTEGEGLYDLIGNKFYPLKTQTVVQLDPNGGNQPTNYVYATAGEAMPSPIDVPTRNGYTFLGYATAGGEWTVSKMTGNVTDVINEGETVWALAPQVLDNTDPYDINGVRFERKLVKNVTSFDEITLDKSFEGIDGDADDEEFGNDKPYGILMKDKARLGGDKELTITLKSLTPGVSYLVQIVHHCGTWGARERNLSVDGVHYYDAQTTGGDAASNRYGWSFVRRFVASGETETITLKSTQTMLQINTIQLRKVSSVASSLLYYYADGTSDVTYPVSGGPTTLYAQWELDNYLITYAGLEDAGDPGNPVSYTVYDEIYLRAPKRDGYVFGGWWENDVQISYIPTNTTGAKTLTATWVNANAYTPIEYIATTNCQFLDTGVCVRDENFGFYLDFFDSCYIPLPDTKTCNGAIVLGSSNHTGWYWGGFILQNWNDGGVSGTFDFLVCANSNWGQYWFDPMLANDKRLVIDFRNNFYRISSPDDPSYGKAASNFDIGEDQKQWLSGSVYLGAAHTKSGPSGYANGNYMRFYALKFYNGDQVTYDAIPAIENATGHIGLLRVDGTEGELFAYSKTIQQDWLDAGNEPGAEFATPHFIVNGNGGEPEETAVMKVLDEAAQPALTLPVRAGFSLMGFTENQDGSGTKYFGADGSLIVMPPDGATIYAQWMLPDIDQATVILSPSAVTLSNWQDYANVRVTVIVDGGIVANKMTFSELAAIGIDAAWGQTPTATVGTYPLNLTGTGGVHGSASANFRVNPDAPSAVDGAALWFDAADGTKLTSEFENGTNLVKRWDKTAGETVNYMAPLPELVLPIEGNRKFELVRRGTSPIMSVLPNGNTYLDFGGVYNCTKAGDADKGYGATMGWWNSPEDEAVTNCAAMQLVDVFMVVADNRESGGQFQHFLSSPWDSTASSKWTRFKGAGMIVFDPAIDYSEAAQCLLDGSGSVDGIPVIPKSTYYPDGFHVLRLTTDGTGLDAAALCSYKGDAQGGLKYGEIIAFESIQSDAAAAEVIDYLYTKWITPKQDNILIRFNNDPEPGLHMTNVYMVVAKSEPLPPIRVSYMNLNVTSETTRTDREFVGYYDENGVKYFGKDGKAVAGKEICTFAEDTTLYAWYGLKDFDEVVLSPNPVRESDSVAPRVTVKRNGEALAENVPLESLSELWLKSSWSPAFDPTAEVYTEGTYSLTLTGDDAHYKEGVSASTDFVVLEGVYDLSAIRSDGPVVSGVTGSWLKAAFSDDGKAKTKDAYQGDFFKTNANGVVAWQAYVLGFTGAEVKAGTAKIVEETVQDANPETVTIRLRDLPENPRTNGTCRLAYSLYAARTTAELLANGGAVVTNLAEEAYYKWDESTFEAPLSDLSDENPVNYYRIKVHFIFGGGGGGASETVLVAPSGAVVFDQEPWQIEGDGGSQSCLYVQLPDSFATDGGWIRLEFDATRTAILGYQGLSCKDAEGRSIDTAVIKPGKQANVIGYSFSDGFCLGGGANSYDRAYYIPPNTGAARIRVYFQRSNVDGDTGDVGAYLSVSDLGVSLVDEAVALQVADKCYGVFQADYQRALKAQPPSIFKPENVPNLRTALKNGHTDPYKILFLGDSILWDAVNGQLPALLHDEFASANIEVSYVAYTNGGANDFLNNIETPDFTKYDCVCYGGSCVVRNHTGEYTTWTPQLLQAIRTAGCEVVIFPALLCCEPRSTVANYQNNYWDVSYLVSSIGQEWTPTNELPSNNWWYDVQEYSPTYKTYFETECVKEGQEAAICNPVKMIESFLWGSSFPLAWHLRDAMHNNEYGKQFNARLIVECLKAIRDSAD